jgi:hypothetical protein
LDNFLGVRDEGSQAGVPPWTTCSGRGVEGTSGTDDGAMGLGGSRSLQVLKSPIVPRFASELTCQTYNHEKSMWHALTDKG